MIAAAPGSVHVLIMRRSGLSALRKFWFSLSVTFKFWVGLSVIFTGRRRSSKTQRHRRCGGKRACGCAARGCAASAVDLNDHGILVVVLLRGLAVVGFARGQHLDVAFWQFPFSRSVLTKRNPGENVRKRTLGKRSRDRVRLKRNRKCIRSGRKRIRLRRTESWAGSRGPLLNRLRRRARPSALVLRVGVFVLRRNLRQHWSCGIFNHRRSCKAYRRVLGCPARQ